MAPEETQTVVTTTEASAKALAVEIDSQRAFEIVRSLLGSPKIEDDEGRVAPGNPQSKALSHVSLTNPMDKSAVGCSADPLRLQSHNNFAPSRSPMADDDVDSLLEEERRLQIQIERLDALESLADLVDDDEGDAQDRLVQRVAECDVAFDELMTSVKQQDRHLEKQVRSFHAFLVESAIPQRLRGNVAILNYDPSRLHEQPTEEIGGIKRTFGERDCFGPLDKLMHDSGFFGLMVLGTEDDPGSCGKAKKLGMICERASAVGVMAASLSRERFPDTHRWDVKGVEARIKANATPYDAKNSRPTIDLDDQDMQEYFKGLGKIEGLDNIVMGFAPIRVRRASRWESEDVTISPAYVLGGKLAYVATASTKFGVGSSVSRADKNFVVGDYAYKHEGPMSTSALFNVEGNYDILKTLNLVVQVGVTNPDIQESFKGTLDVFQGQGTASGERYSEILATCMLRRVAHIIEMRLVGMNESEFQKEVDKLKYTLPFLFCMRDAGDLHRPFKELEIEGKVDGSGTGVLRMTVSLNRVVEPVVIEIRQKKSKA